MKKAATPKSVTVSIGGTEYPCYMTMGAFLFYKQETGKEVSQLKPDELTDLIVLLWCCVRAACVREGKEFGLTLEQFACSTVQSDLDQWATAVFDDSDSGDTDSDGEKKSRH